MQEHEARLSRYFRSPFTGAMKRLLKDSFFAHAHLTRAALKDLKDTNKI